MINDKKRTTKRTCLTCHCAYPTSIKHDHSSLSNVETWERLDKNTIYLNNFMKPTSLPLNPEEESVNNIIWIVQFKYHIYYVKQANGYVIEVFFFNKKQKISV